MPRSKAHSDPRGSDDDAAPDAKRRAVPDSTTGAPATTTGSKRWTNAEYVQLWESVNAHGTHGNAAFESAVPGRTRNQSYQAWR